MATFIKVTNEFGEVIRLNVEHIQNYKPYSGMHGGRAIIVVSGGNYKFNVKETPAEIDELIAAADKEGKA